MNLLSLKGTVFSRSSFRCLIKKLRRKAIRQAKARARDDEEQARELLNGQESPDPAERQLAEECEQRERERLNAEWLQREVVAQAEFQKKKEKEEKIRLEKEEQARKIHEEWEVLQQIKKRENDEKEAKKQKEAALLNDAKEMLAQDNGPWHNPMAPPNYASEQQKQNCPFYMKTGACRFGDRCSRGHPRPNLTCTLLIPGMFSHFSIDQSLRDEFDSDISLEYEDSEFYQHFRDFYRDVLPEFKNIGRVVQFKVCRNYEPHLRGNVYVQFEREEDAWEAFQKFNGRYYAGKQLSCEFSLVTKWKAAICGLYHRNKCPKGKTCNFLHVFKNPNREFYEADQGRSPSVQSRNSEYSARSSTRSSSSRSSRRSSMSHHSKRHSDSPKHSPRRHRSSSRSQRSTSKRSRSKYSSDSEDSITSSDSQSAHRRASSHDKRKKSRKSHK